MANNRTMQQKNLMNRKRQMKEMLELNRLIMSTHQYWIYESGMSEYMKQQTKYANKRDKKYVIYFNFTLNKKDIIERKKYQYIQQIYKTEIIEYTDILPTRHTID